MHPRARCCGVPFFIGPGGVPPVSVFGFYSQPRRAVHWGSAGTGVIGGSYGHGAGCSGDHE
jgi:hypothetical protein